MADDRASAELVGYALVFAVVLLGIAVVTATGYAGLQSAQEFERTTNAERGLAAFADGVGDVVRGAPSRATEVRLGGGTLSMTGEVTVEVAGERVDDPDENFSRTVALRPVVYESEGTEIAYVSGAVVRRDAGGATMLREPDLVVGESATLVPVVATAPRGPPSTGGSRTALLRAAGAGGELVAAETATYDVTIRVTSPRADAWERYLRAQPGTTCSRSGDTVACEVRTDRVYVTVDRVGVRLG